MSNLIKVNFEKQTTSAKNKRGGKIMAEYTLGQVIDKLGRNRNLKFKHVAEEPYRIDKGAVIALDKEGYIVNQEGEPILSNFSLGSKFRLVNEPVSFTEAIKAFIEEKIIYCELKGNKCRYIPLEDDIFHPLWDKNQNTITAEEILHGKWFIEEGEKC